MKNIRNYNLNQKQKKGILLFIFNNNFTIIFRKINIPSIDENELIETDILDDISIYSICDQISIIFPDKQIGESIENAFKCQYYKSRESDALISINSENFIKRGNNLSYYYEKHYIKNNELNNINEEEDIYELAIKKLHISFIPNFLPCRELEKNIICDHIKNIILNKNIMKPIYISGMPGTYINYNFKKNIKYKIL